jgi:serine/threonine protein kinase
MFSQLLDALEHMHKRGIAHRDIKLENVLVDSRDMTLKVADFGYAAQGLSETQQLRSYRGTFTYMAPEIKEGRAYDGKKADLFSAAVVLFILVRGIFPFKEARKEEYFYNLLCQRNFSEYWTKVESTYLSAECRDLLQRMLAYNPDERPSIAEIRAHPWMTSEGTSSKLIQSQLVQLVNQSKSHEKEIVQLKQQVAAAIKPVPHRRLASQQAVKPV